MLHKSPMALSDAPSKLVIREHHYATCFRLNPSSACFAVNPKNLSLAPFHYHCQKINMLYYLTSQTPDIMRQQTGTSHT